MTNDRQPFGMRTNDLLVAGDRRPMTDGFLCYNISAIINLAISSSYRFVSAHPRNDLMLGGTFLSIERRVEHSGSNVTNNNHHWEVIYTDADWETM